MRDTEKTIGNIIDKQKICHLSSVDSEGFPNTKAMLKPRKREGIKHIYLSTNTSSMRVSQFRENPKASLYFTDSRFFRGVMMLGTVEVLEDAEHKEMIWESGDTMYYPQGVRRGGGRTKGPSKRTKEDDEQFETAFGKLIAESQKSV